jgi:hypothetical protein
MGRTTNFLCGGSGCQPRSESMTKKPMMQVTAGGGYNRASSERQARSHDSVARIERN